MKVTFLDLYKNQRHTVPPAPVADLTGKTVLVTGANTGLGYEAAKYFASMNPGKLIIACRSRERGEEAVTRLKAETGLVSIYLRLLDLAKFSSVIDFADKFEKEEDRLDIAIANAAIAREYYSTTEDGWETGLQVNNLSTLLLNIRLLPVMLRTGQKYGVEPRLVTIGSGTHYWTRLQPEVTNSDEPLEKFSSKEYCTPAVMHTRYPDTKLLNLFMTRPLARALEKTPIVANVVCPGFCQSDLRRERITTWKGWLMFLIMDFLMGRPADGGARQFVWAALADKGQEMRGAYIDNMRIFEPSDYAISQEGLAAEEKIWADMIKVISKVDPKIPTILRDCKSFKA